MTLNQMKTLTVALLCAALLAQPVQASENSKSHQPEELSKEQAIGISSGSIIGGIIAGPPGAFVAAMVGDIIAKNIIVNGELDTVKQQLASTELNYQQQLTKMERQQSQELLQAKQQHKQVMIEQAENFLMSLMFAKGSSEVPRQYQPQIIAMASLLKKNPDIAINLSGYTDAQGSKEKNLTLANSRVTAVKAMLLQHGVNELQIFSEAIGEVALEEQEKVVPNSFDRRVVMQLTATQTEVAKN